MEYNKQQKCISHSTRYLCLAFFAVLLGSFCCTSSVQLLKERHPAVFEEIVGTWQVLSFDSFGKREFAIVFYEDGSARIDHDEFKNRMLRWATIHAVLQEQGKDLPPEHSHMKLKMIFIWYADSPPSSIAAAPIVIEYGKPVSKDSFYAEYTPPIFGMKFTHFYKIGKSGASSRWGVMYYCKNAGALSSILEKHDANAERDRFAVLNKKSLRDLNEFIGSVKNEKLKEEANGFYESLFGEFAKRHVASFIRKKHPFYSKYLEKKVYDPFGNKLCSFYELFIMPATLNKDRDCSVNIRHTRLGHELTIDLEGRSAIFYFRDTGKYLVFHAMIGDNGLPIFLSSDRRYAQYAETIIGPFTQFPSYENLDSSIKAHLK